MYIIEADIPLHRKIWKIRCKIWHSEWLQNVKTIISWKHFGMFSCTSNNTTLCDKVCQRLATGRWFSLCTPVSSTNKTDHQDITEILLKVALNTINHEKLVIINHLIQYIWVMQVLHLASEVFLFFVCSHDLHDLLFLLLSVSSFTFLHVHFLWNRQWILLKES